MTDADALLTAICAAPDDDLPRLVFADWLDETGEADRADFTRAQCRYTAAEPWEPFAVHGRHHRPEWLHGQPWRRTLPRVDGDALQWHPERAFRRGFGWALIVRNVRWLLKEAPRLFAEAPLGELHLPTATLSEWQQFAEAEWLPHVKAIHFFGTDTPIEPIRELCRSQRATGIEELVFESASRAGMPVLLEDLLQSPLGRQLKRLTLRVGPDVPDVLVRTLSGVEIGSQLEQLTLATIPVSEAEMFELYQSSAAQSLKVLNLENIPGVYLPTDWGGLPKLRNLRISSCRINHSHAKVLAASEQLKSLELSDNLIERWLGPESSTREQLLSLTGLQSLNLRRTLLQDESLSTWLLRSAFWPNLVELDLRDNRLTDLGAKHLMEAPLPEGLTAILLDGNPFSDGMRAKLREHFGERLIHDWKSDED